SGANLSRSWMFDAILVNANLDGADLRETILARADLTGATMVGAKFCHTSMPDGAGNSSDCYVEPAEGYKPVSLAEGLDQSGRDLSGMDFRGKDLSGHNLAKANLSGSNLSGAILTDSDLSGANLTGANLVDADMTGANLASADLTDANLWKAKIDDELNYFIQYCRTTMTDGKNIMSSGDCAGGGWGSASDAQDLATTEADNDTSMQDDPAAE
ncbi:MAG: pentapeptide repeat-containing protein, partial [Pontixanthobacter sp.]